MKSFLKSATLLALTALLSVACIKENLVPRAVEPGEDALVEEIHFKWDKVRTIVSSSITIPIKLIVMDDGTEYTDPALLTWSVSNDKMASITQEGKLTTKTTTGELTVTAQADGVTATIPVYITNGASTTGIDKTALTVFDKGAGIQNDLGGGIFNTVPQGFDITKDGKVYYLRVSNAENSKFRMFLNQAQPNASAHHYGTEAWMEMHFFGHGTNFAIEEDGEDKYVWVSTYGTKLSTDDNKDKQYWHEQVIGRFKFQHTGYLQPKDAVDYFYIGQRQDIHAAIDVEGDDLMIYYADSHPDTPRHFVIYSLSEALKAPLQNKTLSSLTYGGDGSGVEEVTDSPTLKVRDLTKLTKKAEFGFQGQGQAQAYVDAGGDPSDPGALSFYSYQGFDIHDGAIYFYEGEGQYKSNKSHAYITVFNYAGQIIEKRTKVNIAEDWTTQESNDITSNGYLEGEGLKVRNGSLYVCFGSNPDGYSRGNIFKFNVAKLK